MQRQVQRLEAELTAFREERVSSHKRIADTEKDALMVKSEQIEYLQRIATLEAEIMAMNEKKVCVYVFTCLFDE
jgi:hypothetical protein